MKTDFLIKYLNDSWKELLKEEFDKKYFHRLEEILKQEYRNNVIYPKIEEIFYAYNLVKLKDIKVVIIGQDPYYKENQACGLSFSTKNNCRIPCSLKNIYEELKLEYNFKYPNHGSLIDWVKQGVFLINSCLTVRKDLPNSHKNIGWENFTNATLSLIDKFDNIVYFLWGKNAHEKEKLLLNKNNLILKAAHPSPFSANNGFFGCNHFKLANEFFFKKGIKQIDWKIKDI